MGETKIKSFKLLIKKSPLKGRKGSDRLVFKDYQNLVDFSPVAKLPLPKSMRIRFRGDWWVRCINNEMLTSDFCHNSFVEINALYDKKHPCWNCPLGKSYRRQFSDDNYTDERIETFS